MILDTALLDSRALPDPSPMTTESTASNLPRTTEYLNPEDFREDLRVVQIAYGVMLTLGLRSARLGLPRATRRFSSYPQVDSLARTEGGSAWPSPDTPAPTGKV